MSSMQRNKGKRGERLHAKVLRTLGVTDARRGVQHAGGPDSPDVIGIPGTHAEVKYLKSQDAAKSLKHARDFMHQVRGVEAPYVILASDAVYGQPPIDNMLFAFAARDAVQVCTLIKVLGRIPDEVFYVCKKRHAAVKFIEQAERDAGDGVVPYAVLRENGMSEMDEVWVVRARDAAAFAGLLIEHTQKGATDD